MLCSVPLVEPLLQTAAVLHCEEHMVWSIASTVVVCRVKHVMCVLQAIRVARPLHHPSCSWRLQSDRTAARHAVCDCRQFSQCSQDGLVQWQ